MGSVKLLANRLSFLLLAVNSRLSRGIESRSGVWGRLQQSRLFHKTEMSLPLSIYCACDSRIHGQTVELNWVFIIKHHCTLSFNPVFVTMFSFFGKKKDHTDDVMDILVHGTISLPSSRT